MCKSDIHQGRPIIDDVAACRAWVALAAAVRTVIRLSLRRRSTDDGRADRRDTWRLTCAWPLPLLSAMTMARTAIAHLGRGRIVNPPTYTARDWYVPPGADA